MINNRTRIFHTFFLHLYAKQSQSHQRVVPLLCQAVCTTLNYWCRTQAQVSLSRLSPALFSLPKPPPRGRMYLDRISSSLPNLGQQMWMLLNIICSGLLARLSHSYHKSEPAFPHQ